jgi:N-acetylneuraminic acid mutarotase
MDFNSDGLDLQDNGGDDIFPNVNGPFTFPTPLATGTPYSVTISRQPNDPTQNCVVIQGTGIATANVTNIVVNCKPGEWAWIDGADVFGQSGTYGTQGTAAAGNVPGAREFAASWTDTAGNFWLFGGNGDDSVGSVNDLNDLWKYTASTNLWTWIGGSNVINQKGTYGTAGTAATTNVPGARDGAVSFTDAHRNFWLFGGEGYDSAGNSGDLNDLWKFDGFNWTWVTGSSVINQAGTYGNEGSAASGNVPGARLSAASWVDQNGDFWFFGGLGFDSTGSQGSLNDLWKFDGFNWTWEGGANVVGQKGTYGTQGTAAGSNVPGARDLAATWIDKNGNLWLFGGQGFDSTGAFGFLNDLWEYSTATGQWTWMGGSNVVGQPGTYGTQGIAAANNIPGARGDAVTWTDAAGNFWLFGGSGEDSEGDSGNLGDLWEYSTSTGQWTWISGSNFQGAFGQPVNYGTQGTPGLNQAPGARRDAVGWIDANGNLWLFGGNGYDSVGNFGFLNDLWEFAP